MSRSSFAVPLYFVSCTLLAQAQPAHVEAPARRAYDVVIETGMPHLEENLRYATIRARTCVDINDLARTFPVLDHVSLQDCRLALVVQRPDGASYALRCTGGHGTTGEARWQFDATSISGTLNVKLGAKNMTFYQRITGRAVGACRASSPSITSLR